MQFLSDLFAALRDHPSEVLICIAFPVLLILIFGGDGPGVGGGSGDCDGGGD